MCRSRHLHSHHLLFHRTKVELHLLHTRRPPRRLDDPKLCKNFLLGFCPAEEFQRTKHDYGTCTLDHDEAAKAQVRTKQLHIKQRLTCISASAASSTVTYCTASCSCGQRTYARCPHLQHGLST